jgi:hypothetical protein
MAEQDQIAYKALRSGGANPLEAWILVQKSAANLLQQGVQNPIHIPWH